MPYEAHERLRSHRGVDLTGKLRVWACAQDDYIILEFFVGRTVSNEKSFSDFQRKKARSWRTSSGHLYYLLRRNLHHGVGLDPVDHALDPTLQREVRKYLHDAVTVREVAISEGRTGLSSYRNAKAICTGNLYSYALQLFLSMSNYLPKAAFF